VTPLEPTGRPRILIAGGGYVGLYAALELERRLRPGEAELVMVTPDGVMTYQPFLPETASGNIEPRHVVIPLRGTLPRTRLITGRVQGLDHDRGLATILPIEGEPYEVGYDHVVLGIGAVSRVLPIPGLAEQAVGFTTVAEAIYLRNQVLSRMDAADSTDDESIRRRALTFVFVGGGYSGIEALAELEDLARAAADRYGTVRRREMRWVLVEAQDRILPELDPELAAGALDLLRERGIEVHLETLLESAEGGRVRLSDGEEFETDTLVWTAGVRANPATEDTGFATDDGGRVLADEYLRVRDTEGAWTAGDCAAVPDLLGGGICPPTAQHALRQARRLARNLVATLRREPLEPFRYRSLGSLISLGRYKGVARVLDRRIKGATAWALHRTYHLLMIPTLNRKVRVATDWTVALFFRRDISQLGSLHRPREPFRAAAAQRKTEPRGAESGL
jgi:NADH:ubiquinone reductase (H+-translocating)